MSDRTLLRLHVEAVWGVKLPSIEQNDIEILTHGSQPSWKLCVAAIKDARITIWRPDVSLVERDRVRMRIDEALTFSLKAPAISGVSREIAFSQVAEPRIDITKAQTIACPLTSTDRPFVESFAGTASDANYYFQAETNPSIGVIASNRLVCVAHSSRRTHEACELGIDTLPDARRKGYALAATLVWGHIVQQEGLVPIYSALAKNTASLSLAHAAGYRPFARIAILNS